MIKEKRPAAIDKVSLKIDVAKHWPQLPEIERAQLFSSKEGGRF